jgi:FkbM family methyltransferase
MTVLQSYWYRATKFFGRRTWIRWGIRYKLFTLLPPIDYEFTEPFYDRVYRGNLDNFIDRVVYIFGAHERQVMEYSGSLITGDAVVLDIGANVGHHALFYSTKAKEVHAFEPNPAFFSQFNVLVSENQSMNIHLHPFGLGEKTEETVYYAPTGDNLGIGSFVEGYAPTNEKVGTMHIVKGDEAVATLNLSRIDFIKIDVEGYEEVVLRGLQETIKKFKPVIIMEYTHGDFSSSDSFQSLTEGYTPYLLRANIPRALIFNDPQCRKFNFEFNRAHGEILLVPDSREA